MDDQFPRPTVVPVLYYGDPWAALDWLKKAFGFERSMIITDGDGKIIHSEMHVGDGLIHLGPECADYTASPTSVSGRNTQSIHVRLQKGLDAHCENARAAGAMIVREPEDQFYGDRAYSAMDPQGHVWTFGQTIRHVTREDAERESGLNIEGWP
jgi:uncharacterized glyoxalase superfamily protein PhnB